MRRFINIALATGKFESVELSYVSNVVVTEFRKKSEKKCKSIVEKLNIPDLMCFKRCFLYHGQSNYVYFGKPLLQVGCAVEICYLNADNEGKTITKNINVIFSDLPEWFNPNRFNILLPRPVKATQNFKDLTVDFDVVLELD